MLDLHALPFLIYVFIFASLTLQIIQISDDPYLRDHLRPEWIGQLSWKLGKSPLKWMTMVDTIIPDMDDFYIVFKIHNIL